MMPPEAAPLIPPPVFNTVPPRPLNGWRARLGAVVMASVAPALVLAAFVVPSPGASSAEHGARLLNMPSLCLFYALTGLPCPGCGITRSCVCFAHGRLSDSIAFHPLGPLTFLVLCLFALRPLLLSILPGSRRVRVSDRVSTLAVTIAAVLFVLAWIARLVHFLPPVPPA